MRIKYTYTTKSRLCFWACTGSFFYIYVLGNEHVDRNFFKASQKYFWMFDLNYEEWKRRERYRWSEYLRNWDPLITGNTGRGNMGYLSASVFDKWFYGNRKFQDPPTYDQEANQFIAMSDKCGVDPAKPLLDSIRKMVDAYYPEDLDDDPSATELVKAPHVQWLYQSNFDDIMEEEDKKPKANTLARYLWFVPGYQEYFSNLKDDARNQEEAFLLNSDAHQRTVFYEETDRLSQRWALELNDYAPLLANKWEKKHALAKYLMDKNNREFILDTISKPGGVKRVFIEAGIIHAKPVEVGDVVEFEPIH